MNALPGLLSSRDPGWTEWADVIVVGSGIAGLTAALRLRGQVERIAVVTKDVLAAGSTQWAQGGIAAALGPGDTPEQHERDTLVAGAGACDRDAVRVLVTEGPDAVRELIEWGANFDKDPAGNLSLTREGGHHRDRIAHANGDATGAEIQRALIEAVKRAPEILVFEHAMVVDLVTAADGGVAGLTIHVTGEGDADGVGLVRARAVVLASGGLGQVFSQTTNPAVSTADGMAIALRAGARLRDLEFVQFHPTVMYLGLDSRGQQPLISEAVRGEGAFLVDAEGNRFMQGVHELADLAPRDIVSKAIMNRMLETGHPNMWLDARHLGLFGDRAGDEGAVAGFFGDRAGDEGAVSRFWQRRFPNILASCRAHGVDPVTELIPVAPACHYASGGVHTDLWGRSTVPGLYATGEVACSGVHGANRLASNSLLEGLVFSRRIATVLPGELRPLSQPVRHDGARGLVPGAALCEIQEVMTSRVGVLRNAAGLAEAVELLGKLATTEAAQIDPAAWETTNVLTISLALAQAALRREETRGSHWREDFPERDDTHWAGHCDAVLADGVSTVAFTASPATDGA
jgi:L-aspartate oxidase